MFRDGLRLHGVTGELLWGGYRQAARVKGWTIEKVPAKSGEKKHWLLTGSLEALDLFVSRQRPLFFTAIRNKGRWLWPVEQIQQLGPNQLRVTLGAPLQ